MKQRVIVIGHSFSSRLSIIRSVAQLGCEVTVIVMTVYKSDGKTLDKKRPIDCYSKYVNNVYYCHRKDKDGLIRILLDECADEYQKAVLFPDSDDTVVFIDNNRDILSKYFFAPYINNGSSSIEYWMNKTHQKEAALKVGLDVADGVVIDIKDGSFNLSNLIQYPCYTKPLATLNGGKGGMYRCDNEYELVRALNEYITTRTPNGKVLVEQYKEIETEYALLGFSDGKDVVIPGIMHLMVVSKKNKGIALQGKVEPINGFEEIIEKFKQLALNIGFVGVFDIDFYKSENKLYFCEMNLRFGGSGYAITKMGVNLPGMFVKKCRGEDWKVSNTQIQNSAIYVNERMLMDDWSTGYISLNDFTHFLKSAEIRFIPDEDDPVPERQFIKSVWRRKIIIFVKHIIRR